MFFVMTGGTSSQASCAGFPVSGPPIPPIAIAFPPSIGTRHVTSGPAAIGRWHRLPTCVQRSLVPIGREGDRKGTLGDRATERKATECSQSKEEWHEVQIRARLPSSSAFYSKTEGRITIYHHTHRTHIVLYYIYVLVYPYLFLFISFFIFFVSSSS